MFMLFVEADVDTAECVGTIFLIGIGVFIGWVCFVLGAASALWSIVAEDFGLLL